MKLLKVLLLGLTLMLALGFVARAEEIEAEETEVNEEVVDEEEVEEEAESDIFTEEERATIEAGQETHEFQAEVNRLMDIIINSLYSDRKIFLRELISNAADALDKIRFEAITDKSVLDTSAELDVRVSFDQDEKTLTITDSGIGMTKDNLMKNLGVVAKSGTTEFVEAAASGGSNSLSLIGQFGVGFYSVYLVADRVTVVSKNNDDDQYIWESTANSVFTIAKDPRGNTLGRGTSITLHLKDDAEEFLNENELKGIIKRYSEFINFPIYLRTMKEEEREVPLDEEELAAQEVEADEESEDDEDLEVSEEDDEDAEEKPTTKMVKEMVESWDVVNEVKAIWTRSPKEIEDEEYNAFFKALGGSGDAMDKIHFVAEGEITFRSILFIPDAAPYGMYDNYYSKSSNLKLYVRRVLIADEFDEFLPKYLNFVKGVVDSDDLPINVSRETLAQSRILKVMSKKLTRKVLEMLKKMAQKEEEAQEEEEDDDEEADEDDEEEEEEEEKEIVVVEGEYTKFWKEFGKSIKLGVIDDRKNKSKLTKLLRFITSKSNGKYVSLESYVDRMGEDQKNIYFLTGESMEAIENSPFLEQLKNNDLEVIYMDDPLDEYVSQSLTEFDGHSLQSASKAGLKVGDEDEKLLKQLKKKWEPATAWIKDVTGVDSVEVSTRLATTPCIVVTGQYGWGANMGRIMSAQTLGGNANEAMYGRKTLEINSRHPLLRSILEKAENDDKDDASIDLIRLMFDAALSQSGFPVQNANEFAERINRIVSNGFGVEANAPMGEEDELEEEEEIEEEEVEEEESVEAEDDEEEEEVESKDEL